MTHRTGLGLWARSAGRTRSGLIPLLAAILLLAACKEERNAYVAPPPPRVTVAAPLSMAVPTYIETTGTVAPVNQVDLVARVPGFLQQIGYRDGETAQQGQTLFVIEPQPYQASLMQAQGTLVAAQAELVNAEAQLARQQTLLAQNVSDRARYDDALAKRDQARGSVQQAQAGLLTAQINLGYTNVAAPFTGPVTAHTTSVGQYVGGATPTTLATILQTDPIWVNFTISQQQNLRIREQLIAAGVTTIRLDQIVVEVGMSDRRDFPIAGTLDYISPEVDTSTGTQAARAVFANSQHVLTAGFFVRVRVRMPQGANHGPALLVPETALGADQSGRYLLVVDAEDKVAQRNVTLGQRFDGMIVVDSGLKLEDRVVVNGLQRAIPGSQVAPEMVTLTPPDIPQPAPAPVRPAAVPASAAPSQPAAAPPAPASPQPAPAAPAAGTAPARGAGSTR